MCELCGRALSSIAAKLPPHLYGTSDCPHIHILRSSRWWCCCCFIGEGWPLKGAEDRIEKLQERGNFTHSRVPHASHHLHLDPHSAPQTAAAVVDFLLLPAEDFEEVKGADSSDTLGPANEGEGSSSGMAATNSQPMPPQNKESNGKFTQSGR